MRPTKTNKHFLFSQLTFKFLAMRLFTLALLIFTLSEISTAQDYYLGGKIGYSFPTNIGRSSDELGFKDVADKAWLASFTGKWFYNKRLSLGCDMGYQYQGGSDIWDVDNYGDVSVSYHTMRLLLNGAYYFSHDEIRPYIGLSFGVYYLINTMDFNASNITNKSVSYSAKEWQPGVAPQFGALFELDKKTFLDVHVQMDLIAHLEPNVIIDPDYGVVTQNPHGNQNQISLNIGLLFGL